MNGCELSYPKEYKNVYFIRSKVKKIVLLCFLFLKIKLSNKYNSIEV